MYSTAEPNPLPRDLRFLVMGLSSLFFAISFTLAWTLLQCFSTRFQSFTTVLKADTCSRVGSTLHAAIVVPLLVYGILTMTWSDYYEPLGSVTFLQTTLCITVGYFLTDVVIIAGYKVPQYGVYVLHHFLASFPYVVYLFIAPCPYGVFVLAMFMLVEFTNLTLNFSAFLQQWNKANSKWYVVSLYITAIGWVPLRIVNPVFCLVTIHTKIYPSMPPGTDMCLIPSTICAYFIAVFCIGAWFLVIMKEVVLRWKSKPNPTEVATFNKDTQSLQVDPKVPMSQTELELTVPSPTRVLLYEAKGKIKQFEDAANLGSSPPESPGPTERTSLLSKRK